METSKQSKVGAEEKKAWLVSELEKSENGSGAQGILPIIDKYLFPIEVDWSGMQPPIDRNALGTNRLSQLQNARRVIAKCLQFVRAHRQNQQAALSSLARAEEFAEDLITKARLGSIKQGRSDRGL